MKHFRMTRLSKKLDHKGVGPYTGSKIINQSAYVSDLLKTMWNHNVFHVSQRVQDTAPVVGQLASELQLTIVDEPGDEEWEVDRILDSRQRYRKLHYLVQWAGYSHTSTSWKPAGTLENAQELVDEFHGEGVSMPRS